MLAAAPLRQAIIAGRDLTVRLRAATLFFALGRLLATLRFVEVRFLATLRFVLVRLLATLRLDVRFLPEIRFFAAAFLAASLLACRMRDFAFRRAFFLAISFLAAIFFAAMCFFTNRRAALIFFSAVLTAFFALLISRAHIIGDFGFEVFRFAFLVAICSILFFQKKQWR
jgi:hypothetical protein